MRLVLDERHHRGDRDPVVRAEGRPVRGQPLTVADEHDPALGGVVRARRVTLAHHVEVPLERDGGRALAALRRGDVDHEVPALVLAKLEPVLPRPLTDVVDHGLLVARRPSDARQRLEVPPEGAGLEPGQDGRLGGHVRLLGFLDRQMPRICFFFASNSSSLRIPWFFSCASFSSSAA